uniref:IgLON family member 5 n=1 Tax=Mastacembelus armatus TaxID=205130 RepID=A0A3Q3RXG4_9TELE
VTATIWACDLRSTSTLLFIQVIPIKHEACSQTITPLACSSCLKVTHKAWLNRSNILFTGTDKWSLDKRVTLVSSNNSDFSIHIDKVQITDEGPYTCTFQANNKPRIANVYLIVQVPARIVNISKNVSVNEGENVNLYCLAVGRPEPTVTWKDQKYGLVSEGEFLDITEIKRQQAEDYECITNNGVAPPDQRKVKVTVNYPPMITDMKNMPAHLGKTAILRCEAMAVPPASFEWYRDDHSDNTLRIKNEKTRSLLLFTNVTEKHFGNYTCFASNRLGASNASMLLFRNDSFIYPLSSFIPLPIISASLPSMTHSSIRPIYLPALFFHQCCQFCQPISPSSVVLPPLSLLIYCCHHYSTTNPFCSGSCMENWTIIGYFCGISIHTLSLTVIASNDCFPISVPFCSPF